MRYIVNKYLDEHGRHEVHNLETCNHLPKLENRIIIGDFLNCKQAIDAAKRKFGYSYNFDGCYYCCNSCHKG